MGPDGWSDRQLADGTVLWTSPTGHIWVTKPGGSLYFPVLGRPTGDALTTPTGDRAAIITAWRPHPRRDVMMPKRQPPDMPDAPPF